MSDESAEIFDDLYLGLRAGGALRKQRRGEPLTSDEREALGRWQRLSTWRKALAIESRGFDFQAEVLVKALARTRTYIEVPMDLMEREHGESKAFRLRNAVDVFQTLRRLRAHEQAAGR